MSYTPKGYGGDRRPPETVCRTGWHEFNLLAVSVDDPRLNWLEREMLHQLGNRLYGKRRDKEAS